MWTKKFWRKTAERMLKSGAQAVIGLWIGDHPFNAWEADWTKAGGVFLGGAVLSLAFCLASLKAGPDDDPSIV